MKMKFGAIVVDGRNKIGGHVASKNRGGAYLRTKVTPVNPQTAAQSGVRNSFTENSQAWRGLTQSQRDSFNAAVSDFQKTDIFGDRRNPSGFNLFMELNQNLANIGVAPITAAPLALAVEAVGSLSVTAAAGTPALSVVFTPTPVPAGHTLVIEATPQVGAGKTFVKNLFRKVAQVAPAGTSPENMLSAYTAKFGSLVAGQKIVVRAKMVLNATGQTSQYLQATAIVAS